MDPQPSRTAERRGSRSGRHGARRLRPGRAVGRLGVRDARHLGRRRLRLRHWYERRVEPFGRSHRAGHARDRGPDALTRDRAGPLLTGYTSAYQLQEKPIDATHPELTLRRILAVSTWTGDQVVAKLESFN